MPAAHWQTHQDAWARLIQAGKIVNAVDSPDSHLTYSSLTGLQKQSVGDVERIFKSHLIMGVTMKLAT